MLSWRCFLVVILALSPSLVMSSPNFSYFNVGYVTDKVSFSGQSSCSQGGISLGVAVPLNEWYYAVASHTDQTSDAWCGATKTQAGAGIHHHVGNNSAVYIQGEAILANYPWDEHLGVGFTAGLRSMIIRGTELKGFVTYESIDGQEIGLFGLGVNMWMNQQFSGYFDIAMGSDSDQRLQLGVRYNF